MASEVDCYEDKLASFNPSMRNLTNLAIVNLTFPFHFASRFNQTMHSDKAKSFCEKLFIIHVNNADWIAKRWEEMTRSENSRNTYQSIEMAILLVTLD